MNRFDYEVLNSSYYLKAIQQFSCMIIIGQVGGSLHLGHI